MEVKILVRYRCLSAWIPILEFYQFQDFLPMFLLNQSGIDPVSKACAEMQVARMNKPQSENFAPCLE